jgi:beta-lactamase regulating signal transducer with metallopeptidase domain
MIAETILADLVRVNLVASGAILVVLALRPLALRWAGASIAYWLWLVVPVAAAATFLPARERVVLIEPSASATIAAEPDVPMDAGPAAPDAVSTQDAAAPLVSLPALADVLVVVWLLGAAILLGRSIVSTRRLAADPAIGPALVGVLRPKLLLPEDFATRFDAAERALILAHEEVHRISGHTVVNALVEFARCASWFNPLVHLAALRIRTDQELACDAAVIAAHPTERRAYAGALLKTQASAFLPLGCTWTSPSAKRLGQRIALLGRPPLSRRVAIAGASTVAVVGLALGYAAWAQQPERVVTQTVRPEPVWTPTADAPAGILSHELEGQRHDFFIGLAQKGDIDLVFFGTTETEMWWWPNRGRAVWDREFGSLKAANFGSQGTSPKSLLWRMQNGELDGYEAKLVVWQIWGPRGTPAATNAAPDSAATYAPLIAEIRARQPQAKILLLAPMARGIGAQATVEEWREKAVAQAAALEELVDDETVFYTDFYERFYNPDGSYKGVMWHGPAGVGAQVPLYELWAEELQPWLDRFVR